MVEKMNLYQKACRLFPYQLYLTRKSVQIIRREWIRKMQYFDGKHTLLSGKSYSSEPTVLTGVTK